MLLNIKYFIIPLVIFLQLVSYNTYANDVDSIHTVKAAIPFDFPPYYQLDENGEPIGFAIDVMNAIAKRSQIQIEYQIMGSWENVFDAVKQQKSDLIPSIDVIKGDISFLDFTLPLETFRISLFVRNDSTIQIKHFSELSDYKIGTVKLNVGTKIVSKLNNVDMITFDSFEQALFALYAGQIDVIPFPESVGWKIASRANQERDIKIVGQPLAEMKRAIGIAKGNTLLVSRLNEHIKEFVISEEYKLIIKKWFSEKPSIWSQEFISWILASILIIFIIITVTLRYQGVAKAKKHLQEMVEQRTKELLHSEMQHSALFESLVDGVITIDDKGVIKSVNPATEHLFGYQAEEVIEKNIKILMPEPYHSKHDAYLFDSRGAQVKKKIHTVRDVQGLKKDGTTFHIELAVSEVKSVGDRLFVGIVRDVTEREKAAQRLIQARDEAEAASRAKSEFLSSMSHELRTPMNAVLGFAQLLELDKEELSDAQNDSVQQILTGGKHLLRLINEVLDLAKIESGKMDCDIKEIALKQIIFDCADFMNTVAEQSKINIDYGNPENHIVMADSSRLKQVLLNYLSNAIKYNRPNGHVTVSYQKVEGNYLRIRVTDTGEGISENDLEMLFQPFSRVGDKSTNITGTGIGLVISKELMTLMDGTVGVSSVVGEGSTFWFEIKLAE